MLLQSPAGVGAYLSLFLVDDTCANPEDGRHWESNPPCELIAYRQGYLLVTYARILIT